MYEPAPYRPADTTPWPTQTPIEPTAIIPAGERRVVGYTRYAGGLAPVYEALPEPRTPPPATVAVRPGVDPVAQRLAATGIAIGTAGAGVGWGLGQTLTAISPGAAITLLALYLLTRRRTSSGTTTVTVHNHNRWLGKSTTNL